MMKRPTSVELWPAASDTAAWRELALLAYQQACYEVDVADQHDWLIATASLLREDPTASEYMKQRRKMSRQRWKVRRWFDRSLRIKFGLRRRSNRRTRRAVRDYLEAGALGVDSSATDSALV